jgi:AcrR family transcriptional regulator
VNKAAIYYHIGEKASLYEAVLKDVFGPLAGELARRVGKVASPEEKLRLVVSTIAETVNARKHLAPIMLREIASGFPHFPAEGLGMLGQVFTTLRAVLEDGRKKGVFRTVNPLIAHLTIVGSIMFYHSSAGMVKKFEGTGFIEDIKTVRPTASAAASQIADMVVCSLRKY